MTPQLLVVDDDNDLRETLQMLLEESGFMVTTAANGRAALERLRSGARPDLILLDLMMPEMNGWDFLARVRPDATLGSIPIVIMTAHKSIDVPSVPREDVLHKPFDSSKLLATIARHVDHVGGHAE
jgi:CheY-like chemotaxis protein